jgi:hypothetical protein
MGPVERPKRQTTLAARHRQEEGQESRGNGQKGQSEKSRQSRRGRLARGVDVQNIY